MRRYIAVAILLAVGAAAHAAETITYSYDSKGRLIQVVHSGTVNNGVTTTYTYDKANNRNQVTTTGASH
jgi:phage gp36-like protein